MKRIILIGVMAAVSSIAQGQTQSTPGSDPENAVRITAPQYSIELPARPHRMSKGDFDKYRRDYTLANGGEMKLTQRGRRMYATLSGGEEKELVAAAHNVFVATDRNLKITLVPASLDDEMTGEILIRRQRNVADAGTDAPVERLAMH